MTQDEPKRIPIDPQEYLNFAGFIAESEGEAVEKETLVFLLYLLSRAFAVRDCHISQPAFADRLLCLVEDDLEYVLAELNLRNPDALRQEVENLRGMTEWWLDHAREQADGRLDSQ